YLTGTKFYHTYRWFTDPHGNDEVDVIAQQTPLLFSLLAGIQRNAMIAVQAPPTPGDYYLQFELIEQDVAYFSKSWGHGKHPLVPATVVGRTTPFK
ncbi:MAG: hypothetical protein M3N19_03130, partial [Candidatus Eremiobacteraeota bacterium]|nr:hypothetical protein [Candidatus Eremiobacteraeota bacterium]